MTMICSDLALSRRLERTEAMAGARFVEARSRLHPGCGSQWMEAAGAYAMFDGPTSPVTQTFGLGLFDTPSAEDLDRIEGFFGERGAPVLHEVSPLADPSLLGILSERDYRPLELTSVMYQPLPARLDPVPGIHVRPVGASELDLWADVGAEGWREAAEFAAILRDLMRIGAAAQNAHPFLAEIEGRPVAAGLILMHEGVALLAGGATIPEWRNRGAQRALLEARLRAAAEAGCDVAMMAAAPGSASQRNAERQGFRIAYTRTKWARIPA